MELDKERRLEGHGKDPPLHYRRLYVVILDDDVLLEYLDGIDLICPLPLSQHDLSANNNGGSNTTALRRVLTPEVTSRQTNSQENFIMRKKLLSSTGQHYLIFSH